ncbi:MAG: hypothetical protein KKF33_13805 [Alphaproteobacteria bacterium]|nr:hypothetical protein [Alphaproteobacteria bacterium]
MSSIDWAQKAEPIGAPFSVESRELVNVVRAIMEHPDVEYPEQALVSIDYPINGKTTLSYADIKALYLRDDYPLSSSRKWDEPRNARI